MIARRAGIALVILLLPGVLLAPVWRLSGLGPGEDDLLYYYPARHVFHETVTAGQWPWFSHWTGLGRPFIADPQNAACYPLTWLFAILAPLQAYPTTLWIHCSLALWGTYRLLRSLGLDRRAALFGGIAFAFCGSLLAHRAHFTIHATAAWIPWAFWRLMRFANTRDDHTLAQLAPTTAVLALLCFAGHVQIAAITALGTLVFLLAKDWSSPNARRRALGRWLIAWVCAGGVFAIQWLPTLAYTALCTRIERGYWDFVENSWNPLSAVGWILPMLFGQRTPNFFDQPYWGPSHQVEQFAYAGLLPLLLAVIGLRAGWRADQRRRPWVIVGLFGLLLALGMFGPICPLLYWLPGSSLFRCPARAIVLVNLTIAGLAAISVHDLADTASPISARLRATMLRWLRRPVLLSVLLVLLALLPAAAMLPFLQSDSRAAGLRSLRPWNAAVCVPLLIMLASTALLAIVARRSHQPRLLWLIVVLTAVDLGVIGWTIDVPPAARSARDLLTPDDSACWIAAVGASEHRLWVVTPRARGTPGEYIAPIEKAVANTNVLRRITSLTHYGPLQPRTYARRFSLEPWGECTQPERLLADTRWMRLCNIGWILLCDPDQAPPDGCDLITTTDAGWRLYRNPLAAGGAAFEHADQPGVVRFIRHGPSRFTTRVDTWPADGDEQQNVLRPCVVVSQLALPGWTARVGDEQVQIETVDGLLAGVRVPPGVSVEIHWEYFPPGLHAGAAITIASVVVLVLAAVWQNWRRRQTRRGATKPAVVP